MKTQTPLSSIPAEGKSFQILAFTWLLAALLLTIPVTIFLLPPLQGVLYVGVYSWLAIGVVNGWAASRTRSIWPGLVSAALYNIVMTAFSM